MKHAPIVLVTFLLAGCTPIFRDEPRPHPAQLTRVPAPPPFRPMLVVPMPDLDAEPLGGTPLESMSGRNVPIRDVILGLFKDSDLNVTLAPEVEGEATFDIKNATVEAALESILRDADLHHSFDGNFLRIGTVQEAFFPVDLLATTGGNEGGGGDGGGSGGGGGGSESEGIWTTLEADLRSLATGASLIVNQVSGIVRIEARPSVVEKVRKHLERTVRRASQQVSLEARVLEVRLDDEFRMGVNWSVLPNILDWDETGTLGGGAGLAQTAASGGSAIQFGILKAGDYSVMIDALDRQGQVRVLSSPRVATLNNVPATIEIVDNIPVIGREVIDSQGGLRTQFDISFAQSGVTLQVTPQIGADGMITVQVSPSVTEQTGTVVTPDGLIAEPILSTRRSSATVRVPNGEAVVLGGLRSTRKGEDISGVPLLKDLPLLGGFFRSTVQSREEVELMVIVVPRVLDRSWIAEDVRRSAERLVSLRRPFKASTLDLDNVRLEDWNAGSLRGTPRRDLEPRVGSRPPRTQSPVDSKAPRTVTRKGLAGRFLLRGREALRDGDILTALDLFDKVLDLDNRASVLVASGILLARKGDLEGSRRRLDRALRVAPDSRLALTARGVLSIREQQGHHAETLLAAAHAQNPSAWTASNLAAVYLQTNSPEKARAVLATVDDAEVDFPEFFANAAWSHLLNKDLDNAEAMVLRAQRVAGPEARRSIQTLNALIAAERKRRDAERSEKSE